MNKKLTLLLDDSIIEQAKTCAGQRRESLSGMVERYFKFLIASNADKTAMARISPEIEELTGIFEIPDAIDVKLEYRKGRAGKKA